MVIILTCALSDPDVVVSSRGLLAVMGNQGFGDHTCSIYSLFYICEYDTSNPFQLTSHPINFPVILRKEEIGVITRKLRTSQVFLARSQTSEEEAHNLAFSGTSRNICEVSKWITCIIESHSSFAYIWHLSFIDMLCCL